MTGQYPYVPIHDVKFKRLELIDFLTDEIQPTGN